MHAGGACKKQNKTKQSSTKKTPKIKKKLSPTTSNTVNGPCNHKDLYVWHRGSIVSVHRMVMESRPVDPGSIQGSHRPISFIRIKRRTRANDILCKSINNHIVRLVHKNHIIRTYLMYHAACKVEFQPFTRSYSQLTFFNF